MGYENHSDSVAAYRIEIEGVIYMGLITCFNDRPPTFNRCQFRWLSDTKKTEVPI